ncbi:MAG: hypothetical protein AAB849_01615 [Patescibacteria group bacterium]
MTELIVIIAAFIGLLLWLLIIVSVKLIVAKKKAVAEKDGHRANLTVIHDTTVDERPINQHLLELLRQASIGSLWVMCRLNERGRRVYDLLVRGDLDEAALQNLSRLDVVAFDRSISQHRSVLTAFMFCNDGPLARLADGDDIGWAMAELIRKCNAWGVIGGGVKKAFSTIIASRSRQAGSTATETAMSRIEQILAEPPLRDGAPAPRPSQIFQASS